MKLTPETREQGGFHTVASEKKAIVMNLGCSRTEFVC